MELQSAARSALSLVGVTLALSLGACGHDYEDRESTVATTGAWGQRHGAADSLAHSRCEREAECNNIGHGAYRDRTACAEAVRERESYRLRPEACPDGVNKARLDRCLSAVENQLCENPLAPIAAFEDCHTATLCPR